MWAMLRLKLTVLLFLGVSASLCYAQSFGKYVGTVQTEWLDNDDRRMRLLAPFSYVDPKGVTWTAPAGWVIDGASIPVFAWSVIGGPFNGKYRDASVIHDVACDQKAQPWETVHEAFYWAMMASGVEAWRAKVMYAAVYHFGPRWSRVVTVSVPENQVGEAQERALSQADPGSEATVVRVRPQPASPASPQPGGPRRERVDVQIQPPPQTLTQQDFENLKDKIIEAEGQRPAASSAPRNRGFHAAPPPPPPVGAAPGGERTFGARRGGGGGGDPAELAAASGGVSLSDIRAFKPDN
jgi:Protein of unknown function (DUF1353)